MKLWSPCWSVALGLFAAGPLSHAATPAGEWEVIGVDDGVEVARREIPGSPVFAFKGKGIIEASLVKVANILLDDSRSPEWAEDLVESRIIRWIHEPMDYIEYNHVGTPFVMKDRDFVSHVIVVADVAHGKLDVSYLDTEDPLAPTPEKSGCVRGELSGSAFHLTELDGGKRTMLEGEIDVDPKGSVPKWIVNFFQKSWPLDTFRAIRRQALKSDVIEHPYFKKLYITPRALSR